MSYQEKEKALRIMEALSAVDEDLLARCEDSGVKKALDGTKNTKAKEASGRKVIPFYRYTKVVAACAACLVLGIGLLATRSMVDFSGMAESDSLSASMEGIAAENMTNADSAMQEAGAPEQDKVLGDVVLENAFESGDKHIPGELAGMDSVGCPVDNRESLTLEEARKLDVVGAYLPQTIPDGFVMESAKGSAPGSDANEVTICFSRGMDTIRIRVADKYVFDDKPTFKADELTQEKIAEQMKMVADEGDTDTPRGNFAVVYDNGVCVEINADATAEEVWTMYQSIEP